MFYFGYELYENAEQKTLRHPSINQRIVERIIVNTGGSGAYPLNILETAFYIS